MAISINSASIYAHSTWKDVNANNIANVNTDGFTPTNTTIQDSMNSTPIASLTSADKNTGTQSGTDLTKELSDQIPISGGVGANVSAIKTQDDMLGTLLDMKS